ncbi:hypothetical protein KZC55_23265, partial [Salmonella enterica subsp. enterica serovar Javiana]|nr:hypothetical protein [Salmonella enterica subsp. enterica serovar Javiana]
PAQLPSLINSVNQKDDERFAVNQKLTSPWNMLLGAQFEMTPHFNVLTEFGFNQRNSFFVAGEYRF